MKKLNLQNQIHRDGFTLVEVLIATLLVGLSLASLLGATAAFTAANGAGTDISTAEFLIEQIKGLTMMTQYDDLSALDGVSYSPPIGANGIALSGLDAFSQQVTVENVNAADFEDVVISSNFIRVTVVIYRNSRKLSSTSWLRARY
jgi:type II secretory pathway pseudopilin PulG